MSNLDINDVVAHIKEEYILPIKPKISKEESNNEVKDFIAEPPTKKQKLSGRYKKRPKLKKVAREEKLCRSVWCLLIGEDSTNKCTFENCRFSHDIEAFVKRKSKDQEGECHNYRTFGMCHYGVVCSFGGDHIENARNKVNEQLWAKYKDNPIVINQLKKNVQFDLRKRNYDFKKALQVHQKVKDELSIRSNNVNDKYSKIGSESNDSNSKEGDMIAADNSNQNTTNLESGNNINIIVDCPTLNKENKDILNNQILISEDKKEKPLGPVSDEDVIRLNKREKKKIEWRGKTYLAPLTTVGNLPFRRICKDFGADITCGEMALASNLLQGAPSEWALVKRHESENIFGVQLCGSNAEVMIKCAQLLDQEIKVDFIDINMGCPIDLIYKQGGGSCLLRRQTCLEHMVRGMNQMLSVPLTLKMRTAIYRDTNVAHDIIEKAKLWDISLVTLHGRSKEQRYTKLADWDYVNRCASIADPLPLFGNGDVLSYEDYYHHMNNSKVSGIMIARGALIKPWIFKEIQEKKHWDISSMERFDMLKKFVNYGMEYWGSDTEGIEKTRRFLLEWLSFLHRYIPVGILEQTHRINQRPLLYKGRDDLETLMSSRNAKDWIKISEMLCGPTSPDFEFLPKHKANSY